MEGAVSCTNHLTQCQPQGTDKSAERRYRWIYAELLEYSVGVSVRGVRDPFLLDYLGVLIGDFIEGLPFRWIYRRARAVAEERKRK